MTLRTRLRKYLGIIENRNAINVLQKFALCNSPLESYLLKYIYINDRELFKKIEVNKCIKNRYGKFWFVDFVIEDKKMAIECDSKTWHQDKDQDDWRQSMIEKEGYTFLRFKSREIANFPDRCVKKIRGLVDLL